VRIEKDLLTVNGLCIDLKHGEPWDGMIRSKDVAGFSLHKLTFMKKTLRTEGKKEGFLAIIGTPDLGDPFLRRAFDVLNRLNGVCGDGPAVTGLSFLIGLGRGFTPSGDDFLTGVLLGEEIMRMARLPDATPHDLDRAEVEERLEKTNDAGRTLLTLALRGHFPAYLVKAVKGVSRAKNSGEIREAFSAAISQGETSGTDALTGLVWYLEKTTRCRDQEAHLPSSTTEENCRGENVDLLKPRSH
jgi:hypothetical protein